MKTALPHSARLTVQQAADILGVTPGRVRQWLIAEELIGNKFGRAWEIKASEIKRFAKIARPRGNPNFRKG